MNLSVAAAILLWELRRQDVASDSPGDLPEGERGDLRADWYRRLLGKRVRGAEALERWIARGPEIAAAADEQDRLAAENRDGG